MQLKTLFIASLAAASAVVSGEAWKSSACRSCILHSMLLQPSCSLLKKPDMSEITTKLSSGSVQLQDAVTLAANFDTHQCLCDWFSQAFVPPNGVALMCTTGANPVCNAEQTAMVKKKLSDGLPYLGCSAVMTTTAAETTTMATSQTMSAAGSAATPAGSAGLLKKVGGATAKTPVSAAGDSLSATGAFGAVPMMVIGVGLAELLIRL